VGRVRCHAFALHTREVVRSCLVGPRELGWFEALTERFVSDSPSFTLERVFDGANQPLIQRGALFPPFKLIVVASIRCFSVGRVLAEVCQQFTPYGVCGLVATWTAPTARAVTIKHLDWPVFI